MMQPAKVSLLSKLAALLHGSRSQPFQLTRYFTATSLIAFAVLAGALYFLEGREQRFFASAQQQQNSFFAQVQTQLVRDQNEAARDNLVKVYEIGHVSLTHLFANGLWGTHFAPLVASAQAIPIERCRLPPGDGDTSRKACYADLRKLIMALPGFGPVDAPVRAAMKGTDVFKIKVYDLRGLTVYSSELGQIGEDKSDNSGWKSAAAGRPASELVHRDRFSTFEGVAENRDLIQSYIPAKSGSGQIAGVFEIYSDVTPLLQEIAAASTRMTAGAAANQSQVENAAARHQRTVEAESRELLMVILALLVFMYLALLLLVRRAQRLIDDEARARDEAAQLEQEWHRDKLATMGAMAANVSHEVGNPLAIISGLAQQAQQWRNAGDIDPEVPRLMLEQTARIAAMTYRITEFARAGNETPEAMELNHVARTICDFVSFGSRLRGTPIELRTAALLPACMAVRDRLGEVLMGLLHSMEEVCRSGCGNDSKRILVQTEARGKEVVLRIGCECSGAPGTCVLPADGVRLRTARRRVEAMGGRLETAGTSTELILRALDLPADVQPGRAEAT